MLVLVICSLGGSARARAQEVPVQPGPPAPSAQPETYTLHVLAADALSVGAIFASVPLDGASSDDTLAGALVATGVGGLLLGGPIVHAAHGNWGLGLASLGLRLGLPLLGMMVGASTVTCDQNELLCGVGELAMGAMIGEAAAITLDAAVLARWSTFGHPAASRPERPRGRPPSGVTLAPRLVATPNLALIGLGGSFF